MSIYSEQINTVVHNRLIPEISKLAIDVAAIEQYSYSGEPFVTYKKRLTYLSLLYDFLTEYVDGDEEMDNTKLVNIVNLLGIPEFELGSITPSVKPPSTPTSPCAVFLIDNAKNIYSYEPTTGKKTLRLTYTEYNVSVDIASSDTKLWIVNASTSSFIEYNITLSPFTIVFNRSIKFNTFPGSGLGSKNNTTLIGSNNDRIILYNITGNVASETVIFSMGIGRYVTGDIVYNSITDTYIISNHVLTPSLKYYITEFAYNGTIVTELDITSVCAINQTESYGIFQSGDILYAILVNSTTSYIYSITDQGLILVDTKNELVVFGSSQNASCINQILPIPVEAESYALYNWYAASKHNVYQNAYGALYNWWSVKYFTETDPAIIGWHVPTEAEATALISHLGGAIPAGNALAESGTTHWNVDNGATNSTRFTALPGGLRTDTGFFSNFGYECGLRLYVSDDIAEHYKPILFANNGQASWARYGNLDWGYGIRLIKDDSNSVSTITDYDGNVYPVVTIGTQVWMAANLKTKHTSSGTEIPLVKSNTNWADYVYGPGAMCYYNNMEVFASPTLLAPPGWHVPTVQEIADTYTPLGGWSDGGGPLKDTGVIYWDPPNLGATNTAKFNARGDGFRNGTGGNFIYLKYAAYFMINDPGSFNWSWILTTDSAGVSFGGSAKDGSSVRLVKDSTNLTNGQSGFMEDIDGNIYPTICISGKEWMAANFKSKHYIDGTEIPIITNTTMWVNDIYGAMCYFNNIAP